MTALDARRSFLLGLMLAPILPELAAAATVDGPLVMALNELGIAPQTIRWDDGITLIAPVTAEDAGAVPVTVQVTDAAAVQTIHLLAPDNRRALIASMTPGVAAGRVAVTLRIRLAKTQRVTVVARRTDGLVIGAASEIQVTAGGGCRT